MRWFSFTLDILGCNKRGVKPFKKIKKKEKTEKKKKQKRGELKFTNCRTTYADHGWFTKEQSGRVRFVLVM